MQPKQPRAPRHPFSAQIEVVALDTEKTIKGRTIDLNLFGCRMTGPVRFSVGSRVRVRIADAGAVFVAMGRIANVSEESGAGIEFTSIEQRHEGVLEKWLSTRSSRQHTQLLG
jgi:hypothetical protein